MSKPTIYAPEHGTRIIFVDTETDLIGQPDVIPQLVCST